MKTEKINSVQEAIPFVTLCETTNAMFHIAHIADKGIRESLASTLASYIGNSYELLFEDVNRVRNFMLTKSREEETNDN